MYGKSWAAETVAAFEKKRPNGCTMIRSAWNIDRTDVINACAGNQEAWRAYKRAVKIYDKWSISHDRIMALSRDFFRTA